MVWPVGKKHSPETIEKLRIVCRRPPLSPETERIRREKISHTMAGRIPSQLVGRKQSAEERLMRSNLLKKAFVEGRFKPKSGKMHPRWKGGRFIVKGYVTVLSREHPRHNKFGYVLEHRLVMEKHIGRYLKPEEVVHHINGQKNDNRIENLMLFNSNSEHKKYHISKCCCKCHL